MVCGELSLIVRYFDRAGSPRLDVKLDIDNDCALLNTPKKQTLMINTDILVAGDRFLPDIDPVDLTYKTLVINLNDLTAIGADPAWLTLALALPDVSEAQLESFNNSLFDLPSYYDMQLVGGDITHGPLSMTLGIRGFIPMGRTLARSGVKPGDWAYVTDTSGDSAAELVILQDRLRVADAKDADYLIRRHLRPSPYILQGQALHDLANSVIDLPDGLIPDLGRIVKANDCGVCIDLALLPLSDALSRHVESEQALRWALSGGEDYELYFTVPELNRGALDVALRHPGIPPTCIGQMTVNIEGLCFIHGDEPVTLDWKGYDHPVTP